MIYFDPNLPPIKAQPHIAKRKTTCELCAQPIMPGEQRTSRSEWDEGYFRWKEFWQHYPKCPPHFW